MIGPARQVLRDLESARATVESVKGLHICLLSRRGPLTAAARAFLDTILPGLIGEAYKAGSESVLDGHLTTRVGPAVGQQTRDDGETR